MADPRFHKKSSDKTLSELAEISGAELKGDGNLKIEDVSSLDEANSKTISFLDNAKYKNAFKKTKAGACIVAPAMIEHAPDGCQILISDNPYKAYALIAQSFLGTYCCECRHRDPQWKAELRHVRPCDRPTWVVPFQK